MSANTLGAYISEYRKKNKLTQAALAEILFVSNKTVSRWETGAGEPDLEQLARISELIGVPVAKLIGGADEPDVDAAGGAAAKSKIFPFVVFALLALLVVTAAVLPPVLVLSSRVSEEPLPPPGLVPAPEVTLKFEAEYAHLKAMNPQLDGDGQLRRTVGDRQQRSAHRLLRREREHRHLRDRRVGGRSRRDALYRPRFDVGRSRRIAY